MRPSSVTSTYLIKDLAMKFTWKTGILLLILAIPVLIYLFLQGFGSNQFDLPVYYQEGVSSSMRDCEFSEGQHYIPNFSLVNQNHSSITDKDLEGNITVVDFFFTSCPDICPIMTSELSRVAIAFNKENNLKIMSFSVDPTHDTPQVLKSYAENYGADDSQWQFVTGDKKSIYALARCGFILPVQDGDGGKGDFIHSEKLILVDQDKRIRGYYDGTDREDVDRLITEVGILLANSK